jgi:hypothetical protein
MSETVNARLRKKLAFGKASGGFALTSGSVVGGVQVNGKSAHSERVSVIPVNRESVVQEMVKGHGGNGRQVAILGNFVSAENLYVGQTFILE